MAEYRMLEKAFINNRIFEVGEIATVPDDVRPGPHMLPVDSAAKKMAKQIGLVNGPIPDPIDELTADAPKTLAEVAANPA